VEAESNSKNCVNLSKLCLLFRRFLSNFWPKIWILLTDRISNRKSAIQYLIGNCPLCGIFLTYQPSNSKDHCQNNLYHRISVCDGNNDPTHRGNFTQISLRKTLSATTIRESGSTSLWISIWRYRDMIFKIKSKQIMITKSGDCNRHSLIFSFKD
jgi:hypothetical protein